MPLVPRAHIPWSHVVCMYDRGSCAFVCRPSPPPPAPRHAHWHVAPPALRATATGTATQLETAAALAGILFMVCQVMAILFVVLANRMMADHRAKSLRWIMTGAVAATLVLLAFFNGKLKRLHVDQAGKRRNAGTLRGLSPPGPGRAGRSLATPVAAQPEV